MNQEVVIIFLIYNRSNFRISSKTRSAPEYVISQSCTIAVFIKLTDPQSGFRALNRKAIEKIVIEQDGSAHCSEILYKANINKLRIKETPMTVIYNEYGQSLFQGKGRKKGGIQIIKDLLLARIID